MFLWKWIIKNCVSWFDTTNMRNSRYFAPPSPKNVNYIEHTTCMDLCIQYLIDTVYVSNSILKSSLFFQCAIYSKYMYILFIWDNIFTCIYVQVYFLCQGFFLEANISTDDCMLIFIIWKFFVNLTTRGWTVGYNSQPMLIIWLYVVILLKPITSKNTDSTWALSP